MPKYLKNCHVQNVLVNKYSVKMPKLYVQLNNYERSKNNRITIRLKLASGTILMGAKFWIEMLFTDEQ